MRGFCQFILLLGRKHGLEAHVTIALLLLLFGGFARAVSFRNDVAPMLVERCQGCHGADKIKGGYRLDSFEELMQAGESGATPVVAGKAEKSELYRLITTTEEADRMPNKGEALSSAQIALIKRWIDEGARYDGSSPGTPLASLTGEKRQPAPPKVYRRPAPVTALAFSRDGSMLAASGYHEVTLWESITGKLIARIPRTVERVFAMEFSEDGKRLVIAGGEAGTYGEVRVCDVDARKIGKLLDRSSDVMLAVCFSSDGSQIAAGGADNLIRIFDASTGKRLRIIEQQADWVMGLAFSPDGSKLASASRDKSARVFDAKDGAMLTAFLGHEETVYSVAWAGDGNSLFSAGHDRKVQAWAVGDAKVLGQIGFAADPMKIEVQDGRLFVGIADGVIREYSADKREFVREYGKSGDWLYSMTVDEKRHRLVVGGYTGAVSVWDTETGKKVSEWIAAPGYVGPSR